MTKRLKCEFDEYVCDILENEYFLETKKDLHHGTSKYEHSLRVAKLSYKLVMKTLGSHLRPAAPAFGQPPPPAELSQSNTHCFVPTNV